MPLDDTQSVTGKSPEALCRLAESKMHKGGGAGSGLFSWIFSSGPNYDSAADLYVQAANLYKIQKNWQKASETFSLAGYACEKAGDKTRQASLLAEAGHTAKKFSSASAAKWYNAAIALYSEAGRFGQSAKMLKTIAEMFEEEGNKYEALSYYKKAADYFDMDEYGKSQRSACILKYADLASEVQGNLTEAIRIYEGEADLALRNSLLQFGAKEHFLKAGILRLVQGDTVDLHIALERYQTSDPRFASSREGKFFRSLCAAFEEGKQEDFVAAVQDYDSITRLDAWKTHFLCKIRETLEESTAGGAVNVLADKLEQNRFTQGQREGAASFDDEIDLS